MFKSSQDDRLGRPYAYLLSEAYQNYTIYRPSINERDQPTRKYFYNKRYKEEPQLDGQAERNHSTGGRPKNGRLMAGIETLYKEQENKTDITLPSPGILCGEDKDPESLALKVRGTHSGEIQTLWKRQTPLLNEKVPTKFHML